MSLEALSNVASLQEPFVFQQNNEDKNATKNGPTENGLTRQPSIPQLTRQPSVTNGAPRYVLKK